MSDEILIWWIVGYALSWLIVIYLTKKNRRLSDENIRLKLALNDQVLLAVKENPLGIFSELMNERKK